VLSKDGSCKTFSADADGFGRGEAVCGILVKPLKDAIRDGNPVRAVIRATAVNVDGKTPGISQPSTKAQEALMRRAYEVAGITDYGQTAMVECHGTGTPTGDPIETKAVANVFGESGVYIGSVKPNMGHTEGASGLVSVIKMVLALENRIIPPNIRFKAPNPNIPFEAAKLTVPVEPMPWPESRLERVSINSFGVGGANGHVILDSASSFKVQAPVPEPSDFPQLLLYSANSPNSIAKLIENYQLWVEQNPDQILNLAYTLANRREHLQYKSFSVFNNGVLGKASPPTRAAQAPKIVMVFTGQGAQWARMGAELLQSNSNFKNFIKSLDNYLKIGTNGAAGYSIEEELLKPAKKSRIGDAKLSQPLCTAIQIALVSTLRSLGIVPHAVVGHSSGEIAAAYAAEAITAEEAILLAHHRGAVTARQQKAGAMAAIGLGWNDTEKYLLPGVTIACDNSPTSVTISGDADQVKAVVANIKESQPDTLARLLQVNKAYHSYHMAEIGDAYASLLDPNLKGKESAVLIFSTVTGELLNREQDLSSKYWQTNLESPVRFRGAVTEILKHYKDQQAVFLEIGPHSALQGPLRQIQSDNSSSWAYVSALTRNQHSVESFLTALGKLYALNISIDLKTLIPNGSCLPDLPRYPWNHEDSYWYESRLSKEWRFRKYPYHDLLGARCAESTDLEPSWRNLLHLQNAPWIRDHKVGDDIIFPLAGYIALVGEAIRQLTEVDEGYSLRNVIVSTALVVPEGKPTEIITTFRPQRLTTTLNSQWWEFTVASYNGFTWTKHCTGEITATSTSLGVAEIPENLPRKIPPQVWYNTLRKAGMDLGTCFQTLGAIETSSMVERRARGTIPIRLQGDEANYHIHPTIMDGTVQLFGPAAINGSTRRVRHWLPTSIDSFTVTRCSTDMVSSVSSKVTSNFSVVGNGYCVAEGKIVLKVEGLRFAPADGSGSTGLLDSHAAARYQWRPDVEFMDISTLIRPIPNHGSQMALLEELTQLCLKRAKQSLTNSATSLGTMANYITWINAESQSNESSITTTLEVGDLNSQIENIVHQLTDTRVAPLASAIRTIAENLNSILDGQTIDSMITGETMQAIYKFVDDSDVSQYIRHLGHSKPNLSVLEIGTDQNLLANSILKYLTLPSGQILCYKYTVTSAGFISAKDQEKPFANMEYLTLDIGKDPVEQGFEGSRYDLIIAKNAIHGTKSLKESLINIKKLLHPDGQLLLQETWPSWKCLKFIFGSLPKWWCGGDDDRHGEPYVDTNRWHSELLSTGFEQIDFEAADASIPRPLTTIIVARQAAAKPRRNITLLCSNLESSFTQKYDQILQKHGYAVTRCLLESIPPPGQDVISIIDGEEPFFNNIDANSFETLKQFLLRIQDVGIIWLTHLSQLGCRNPAYAPILGYARTARSELLIDFATCEVDNFDSSADNVLKVITKFQARTDDDLMKPDFEYAIKNDVIYVGRFYPFNISDSLLSSDINDRASLDVKIPGRLNTLHWVRNSRESLGGNDVEVEVYSAGLNFRVSIRFILELLF
jgi:acyl transferase domain-containing protein